MKSGVSEIKLASLINDSSLVVGDTKTDSLFRVLLILFCPSDLILMISLISWSLNKKLRARLPYSGCFILSSRMALDFFRSSYFCLRIFSFSTHS